MTTTSIDTAIDRVKEAFEPFERHHYAADVDVPAQSESGGIINALWEADRNGDRHPLRAAIRAARDYGMTDHEIAGELNTTIEEVGARATEVERPRSYW